MRAFIAIDIPENVKKEIVKIQNKLPEFAGKKTEKENLHLTLKFLGEIDEAKIEKIKQKLKDIKIRGFEAELTKIGFFDKQKNGIIWIHMANCEKLQKEIDEKLSGLFEKEKRFMPHLTIARVKKIKNKKIFLEELNNLNLEKIKVPVNNFVLKKSVLTEKKPVYENIEIYNLKI